MYNTAKVNPSLFKSNYKKAICFPIFFRVEIE
jgi:hypothetical protein